MKWQAQIFDKKHRELLWIKYETPNQLTAETWINHEIADSCYPKGSYYTLKPVDHKEIIRSIGKANQIPLPMDQIMLDRLNGLSLQKIANKYGVHFHTIRRRLNNDQR